MRFRIASPLTLCTRRFFPLKINFEYNLIPAQPANQDTESRILQALEQASAHQDLSKSLLSLTYFLQQCLQNRNSQSAIELLMTQPALLDNLRKAHMGNYGP
ncbi:hypothetical protein B0H14DRAFT_2560669 [Mycena olivaceomarginata]|nr:hypothetical protein B0H14DRAFT_2560669 [Mycena olivaceomarginata]